LVLLLFLEQKQDGLLLGVEGSHPKKIKRNQTNSEKGRDVDHSLSLPAQMAPLAEQFLVNFEAKIAFFAAVLI